MLGDIKDKIINSTEKTILRIVSIAFSVFFILIFIAFAIIYMSAQKRYADNYYKEELGNAIHAKYVQISDYFKADLTLLEAMSKSPLVTAFLANPGDTAIQGHFWKEIENYKSSMGSNRKFFFVSKADNNFYFDTNYAYIVNEKLPSAYWFDSTLSRTDSYNFNVDYDPNIGMALIWINFPVFSEGSAVGMLGLGIDIDSFAKDIEKNTSPHKNFVIFNESNEIMFHENYKLIKDKNNIEAALPKSIVPELLELSEKEDEELLFKDGMAYIVRQLPFMRSCLVASMEFEFTTGRGRVYFTAMALILVMLLVFLVCLYKFVRMIIRPLHYFNSLTKTILKEFPIYIAVFDRSGKPQFISRHMKELMIKGPADLSGYLREIGLKDGFFEITNEFEMDNDKSRYFKIVKMNIKQSPENKEQNSIVYLSNVSEQMYLANTDSLTGIANRRYFNERAGTEFYNSQRDKTHIAFLMLDIDFFKKLNDKFGHLAGDEILKDIVKITGRVVERKTDLFGRFGGEEFVIMLHSTNLEGARTVADKIRGAVEEKNFVINNEIVKITLSIGIYSAIPNSYDDLKAFLNEADKKLYEAKESGRNRVCW